MKKKRIFDIIQIGSNADLPSRAFDWFLVTAITLNILVMFLETFDAMEPLYGVLRIVEYCTIAAFSVEYILRIWTADLLYPDETPAKARLHFLRSYDGIVDLLTILPFVILDGFVVFRMLRVVRIFHLFRINAQYDSFQIITAVLKDKKNQIVSSVFIILILMFASSLCMYGAEHDAQPDAFKNAFSGIWWSMSTLLTVGYGDIYPVTAMGKLLAIVIAFLGVGAVAIPTGIISAGFVEHYSQKSHADMTFRDVADIGEVMVDSAHAFCGQTIGAVEPEYDMTVLLILRGDMSLLPNTDLTICENDIMILRSNKLSKKKKHFKV